MTQRNSRLILDPLFRSDPELKLKATEGNDLSQDAALWNSVNAAAKRQAEEGQPAAALEWLGKLPFTSPSDYGQAVANIVKVWNLRSETEATAWVENSVRDPILKHDLLKVASPPGPER